MGDTEWCVIDPGGITVGAFQVWTTRLRSRLILDRSGRRSLRLRGKGVGAVARGCTDGQRRHESEGERLCGGRADQVNRQVCL